MSADRFEISDHGSKLTVRDTKYGSEVSMLRVRSYSRELTVMAGAIRQQARDIAALKDALADEVTANEAFRKAGGARDDEDMPTFCARLIAGREQLRTDLAAAVAENAALLAANRDCILHFDAIKADYDVMKLRAEQAEARLAVIDSAPVVHCAWVVINGVNTYAQLIARPAKD